MVAAQNKTESQNSGASANRTSFWSSLRLCKIRALDAVTAVNDGLRLHAALIDTQLLAMSRLAGPDAGTMRREVAIIARAVLIEEWLKESVTRAVAAIEAMVATSDVVPVSRVLAHWAVGIIEG